MFYLTDPYGFFKLFSILKSDIKYSFQYSVPSDSMPRDTYYVGLMSVWSKETNDVTVELMRIAEQCAIVSPQLGDICLSFFDGAW